MLTASASGVVVCLGSSRVFAGLEKVATAVFGVRSGSERSELRNSVTDTAKIKDQVSID